MDYNHNTRYVKHLLNLSAMSYNGPGIKEVLSVSERFGEPEGRTFYALLGEVIFYIPF